VTQNCKLIIAFFPETARHVDPTHVERILRSHPVRVDRIESTEKGVLVFAESTRCESLDLTNMREAFLEQGRAVGYRVRLQRECLFRAMHSLVLNF
jgi:predicted amino acid-binding ACT domain protein